jgi:methionine-rich copper-binding protein CopC
MRVHRAIVGKPATGTMSAMNPLATMRRTFVALVGAVSILVPATVFPAHGTVFAHTEFDYSLPTEGASVGNPVSEVVVAFTSPVTLVGNGFTALDPQENVVEPFPVTDDDIVFRLQFDPPLAGGAVGIRYEVRSEDGHIVSGSFTFVVDAPVPTTAPPATAPPETTAPPTAPPETTTPATASPETTTPETTTSAQPTTAPAATGDPIRGDDGDGGSNTAVIAAIAAAIAIAAAAFLLVRSRTSGPG